MATVGNLFVNVGASTRGLEEGLKKAQTNVAAFAGKAKSSLSGMRLQIPGLGGIGVDLGAIADRVKSITGSFSGFAAITKAAAEQQGKLTEAIKASEAASSALAGAKGARKNIGEARAMLAKQGINPNKAVAALQIEDTSGLRKKIADAIIKQTDAEKKLAGAQLFAAKAAKGRDPYTGQILSAANKIKVAEQATKDLAKAQAVVTSAVQTTTAAHTALAAVQKSNRDKEATRGKLAAKGIDLSKGQSALKLQDLSPFQRAAAAAKEQVTSLGSAIMKSTTGWGKYAALASAAVMPILAVGAALGAALGAAMAFTMSQAKQMDALLDSAVAAGMNVESMQRLASTYNELGAASGVSIIASQRLGIKLEEAVQGSTDAQASFQRLGVDLEAIASATPDEALQKTIEAIRGLGSHREKMLALRDVFGRSGIGLAAVVNASAEAFALASQRASKIVIPADIVTTLAEANDKVEITFKAFDKLQAVLAAKMVPTLEKMADALFNFMTTDTASLESGFEGIAAVVAVIYEVIVVIVDVIRIAWNAACFLIEGAMMIIAGIVGGIVKLVQAIAYGFELVTGSTHEASAAIGEAGDLVLELTKQLAIAAGTDLGDVGLAMGMDMDPAEAAKAGEHAAAAAQKAADAHKVTVRVEADRAAMKKVNDELQSMRDRVGTLRFGEDSQQLDRISKGSKGDPIKMKEAEGLQRTLKTLEATADVKQQIADISQNIRATYNDSASITAEQLALEKGVDPVLAKQLATLIEREELQKRVHAATKAGEDIVSGLQSQVDGIGKSEMEVLKLKMEQQNIGDDLVQQALELQGILDKANIDESMKSHFTALNDRLLEAQGNERQLLENQLKNIGLAGDALEKAVNDTIAIEDQIKAETKKTDDALTVKDTMKDLADQLEAMKIGESGMLKKKLEAAGADTTQVAEALAMFAEIQAGSGATADAAEKNDKQAQGFVDSIDTALGSFKTQGSMGADSIDKQLVAQGDKQTTLLASIASNTAAISPTGGTGLLMASGATPATLPMSTGMARQIDDEATVLMRESNTYLKAIATNTAAFAGVLT